MFCENTEESRGKIDLEDTVLNDELLEYVFDEISEGRTEESALKLCPEPSWGETYDIEQDPAESVNIVIHRCDSCGGYFVDNDLHAHGCTNTPSNDLPNINNESSIHNNNNLNFTDNNQKTDINITIKKHPRNKKQMKKIPGNIRWMRRIKQKKPKDPILKIHKPRKPGISERTLNDIGSYICHICNKSLTRQSYLTIHMRRHNEDKPFACDHCKMKFVVQYDLDRHTRTHVAKKYSYPCDLCLKPFVTKSGLNLHKEKVHSTCEYCGTTFKGQYQLNLHKRTHKEDNISVGLFQPQRKELQLTEKDLT